FQGAMAPGPPAAPQAHARQQQASKAAARRDSGLVEPLGDRKRVQPPALGRVVILALWPRRELVGALDSAVADVPPGGLRLGVGVGLAVEPVDLLAAGKVAPVSTPAPASAMPAAVASASSLLRVRRRSSDIRSADRRVR